MIPRYAASEAVPSEAGPGSKCGGGSEATKEELSPTLSKLSLSSKDPANQNHD